MFPRSEKFRFVVDFTWDGKMLLLLEMGEFYKSELTGLDALRKERGERTSVKSKYEAELKEQYPQAIYLKDTSIGGYITCKSMEVYDFKHATVGDYNFENFESLPQLVAARSQAGICAGYRDMIVSFSAIKPSIQQQMCYEQTRNLQRHTHILNFGSGGLWNACADKVVFHTLAQKCGLLPETLVVNLRDLDERAIDDFVSRHTRCIIKPTNRSCGTGVTLMESKELNDFLAQMKIPSNHRNLPLYPYWEWTKDPFLILQAFRPSKEIEYKDDHYRPTGRAVIEATFAGDRPELQFIGGYWKLPKLSAKTLSTASVVSDVKNDNVAEIHPDDWKVITAQLNLQFAPVLKEMFETRAEQLVRLFLNSKDVIKSYGEIELEWTAKTLEQQPEEDKLRVLVDATHAFLKQLDYGGPSSIDIQRLKAAMLGLPSEKRSVEEVQEKEEKASVSRILSSLNYPRLVIAPADTTLESKAEALPAAEASLVAESQISAVSEIQDSLEKTRENAMTIINSYRGQNVWFKWFGKRRAAELSVELQACKTTNALSSRIQQFINDGKTGSDYNCFWKFFSCTQSSGTSETSLRRMLQNNFKLRI